MKRNTYEIRLFLRRYLGKNKGGNLHDSHPLHLCAESLNHYILAGIALNVCQQFIEGKIAQS